MDQSPGFKVAAADWRKELRRNQRRTRLVILLFVLIYVAIGLLVDVILQSSTYPKAPLSVILQALLTFQLFPYATVTMGVIALISLWVTYRMYDKIMLLGTEYKEITPESDATLVEKQLYHVVEEMKVAAGLRFMPRVFIIEADYMNAFASGYSEKSAMVAITRGLMQKLDRSEMQAVMAHELSHVRHQDIKLTLMASVLSNIMLIVVDLLFYNMLFGRRDDGDRKVDGRIVLVIVLLRYLLPVFTALLMFALSRSREYMADSGCVELMRDNQPLARALLKIEGDYRQNAEHYAAEYRATSHEEIRRASYLFDPASMGLTGFNSLSSLFSTHPSLQARLKAIGITLPGQD